MAMFHRAAITPTKAELIAQRLPTQSWGPPAGVPIEVIGSHRFDDPEGRVGMVVLRNDRFDLTLFRRPVPGPRPAIGLTATWDGEQNAVVVAEVREH